MLRYLVRLTCRHREWVPILTPSSPVARAYVCSGCMTTRPAHEVPAASRPSAARVAFREWARVGANQE
jgi:hypothetical protein